MAGKIIITEQSERLDIEIIPEVAGWQKTIVGIWIILWVFCGGLVLTQVLMGPSGQRMVLLIYMAFWAYFLLLGGKSFLWLNFGNEKIEIDGCHMRYHRNWGLYSKSGSFELQSVKGIEIVNYEGKFFSKAFNDSFWSFGGESIIFSYFGKRWLIGAKLPSTDAKQLAKRLDRMVKNCRQLN